MIMIRHLIQTLLVTMFAALGLGQAWATSATAGELHHSSHGQVLLSRTPCLLFAAGVSVLEQENTSFTPAPTSSVSVPWTLRAACKRGRSSFVLVAGLLPQIGHRLEIRQLRKLHGWMKIPV